jgi:hypothetical protein
MNLQYITDSDGQTTGVFIPIKEWNDLKAKFKGIEIEGSDIPEWHKDIVRERIENYKADRSKSLDFDKTMDEIEKDL